LSQFLKKTASSQIKHVSLNLEGVSRTKPEHIQRILDLLSDFEFYSLVLCDSLGICLPGDVRQLVSAFKSHRPVNERLVWHGHNDFGLATANSLVAWQSGVDVVSGTFTGIGERAGNLPLEQFILILNEKFGYEFDFISIDGVLPIFNEEF
jgi:homocitrate synthase NifV